VNDEGRKTNLSTEYRFNQITLERSVGYVVQDHDTTITIWKHEIE